MTTTDNPAIGKDVDANGIRTNYLATGSDLSVFSHCGHWSISSARTTSTGRSATSS